MFSVININQTYTVFGWYSYITWSFPDGTAGGTLNTSSSGGSNNFTIPHLMTSSFSIILTPYNSSNVASASITKYITLQQIQDSTYKPPYCYAANYLVIGGGAAGGSGGSYGSNRRSGGNGGGGGSGGYINGSTPFSGGTSSQSLVTRITGVGGAPAPGVGSNQHGNWGGPGGSSSISTSDGALNISVSGGSGGGPGLNNGTNGDGGAGGSPNGDAGDHGNNGSSGGTINPMPPYGYGSGGGGGAKQGGTGNTQPGNSGFVRYTFKYVTFS